MPSPSRFATAMAWLELRGRDRGLRGRSSLWLATWVLATGYRQVKRWTAPEPVVVREVLRPGEQLIVTHYAKHEDPPPLQTLSPRGRKRAARAAARQAARTVATTPPRGRRAR